jgi:hypothetical protein
LTKRENYLAALRGDLVETLTWAPNFDYWLYVNTSENTMPAKYEGMSRNDIVRAIGGTIWNRVGGLTPVLDKSIVENLYQDGNDSVHEVSTPLGTVRSVRKPGEKPTRAGCHVEHFVKDPDSLKVMTYIAEGTEYTFDPEPARQGLAETGDDGVVLHSTLCVPFIQFAKNDAGYINGYYLWTDHREEVDRLLNAYTESYLRAFSLMAETPADIISAGDNMDGVMISPSVFAEYAIPFYRRAKDIFAPKGKFWAGHWCGRTQTLLPQVPGCGLDQVEAIVTRPMADISLIEALDILKGEVTLQGGIPSVLVCDEGGTARDFETYIEKVVLPLRGRTRYIVGMSDNVPPNADFGRVEAVAQLLS